MLFRHWYFTWKGKNYQAENVKFYDTSMADFGNFVQEVFEMNLNFRYQRVQNQKKKTSLLYQRLKLPNKTAFIFLLSLCYLKSRFV